MPTQRVSWEIQLGQPSNSTAGVVFVELFHPAVIGGCCSWGTLRIPAEKIGEH